MLDGDRLCDQFGSFCFATILNEASVARENCTCPESCEIIRYPSTQTRQDIEDDIFCKDLSSSELGEAVRNIMLTRGLMIDEPNCKELLQHEIALLTVEMATGTLTRSKREVRSTFSDRLALVGKYIYLI